MVKSMMHLGRYDRFGSWGVHPNWMSPAKPATLYAGHSSNQPERLMKRFLQLAVVGAALIGATACSLSAAGQRVEGTFDRTLTVSGKADVEVTSGSGRIEVRRGDTGRVEIHGRITASNWSLKSGNLTPEERVRRIEANPPVEQTGGRIVIGRIQDEELQRNVSIAYTVVVPAETTLVSRTGSGAQDITGISGT